MNFLLYMLGRARRNDTLRPQGRDGLRAAAAAHAANGRFVPACDAYRKLSDSPRATAIDILIRGHLHFVTGEMDDARDSFARGMGRLMETGGIIQEELPLQRLISDAELLLSHGRYEPATRSLRQARAMIDLLLSAEAGLNAAQGDIPAGTFSGLTRFSDITLRMLARAELAHKLAGALRERSLDEEQAAWATSDRSVKNLLDREYTRLAELSGRTPAHAETAHRLALVARASGRHLEARRAFERVLTLHPHHMISAIGTASPEIIRRAMCVPASSMRLFANLAFAATDGQFDASAALFTAATQSQQTARGNLAFALSELGMLDESREMWREQVYS